MKIFRNITLLLFVALLVNITGCTGANTFGMAARAGDTIAIMPGRFPDITRADIKIDIIDSAGSSSYIPANDPSIRAFFYSYPDPLSKVVIGYETNQNIDGDETFWGTLIQGATLYDKEWMQGTLVFDLPSTLPTGTTVLLIKAYNAATSSWDTINSPIITIVNGTGQSNPFNTTQIGGVSNQQIQSMERANHSTISFTGATIPHAIEINMTHNADVDNGGVGRAYVVNPRGDIKSINWTDDGTNLKVILMPTHNQVLNDMQDFKFYVAGEIIGLTLVSAQGFDTNGNAVAITASVTP